MFNGVMIGEAGGYCLMWSLFFLDTRLKTLKVPAKEVMKGLLEMMNKDYDYKKYKETLEKYYNDKADYPEVFKEREGLKEFIYLMRGMTQHNFELNMEMVRNGSLSLQDLIMALGDNEDHQDKEVWDFEGAQTQLDYKKAWVNYTTAVDKYIFPIWEKFTTGATKPEDLKEIDYDEDNKSFTTRVLRGKNYDRFIQLLDRWEKGLYQHNYNIYREMFKKNPNMFGATKKKKLIFMLNKIDAKGKPTLEQKKEWVDYYMSGSQHTKVLKTLKKWREIDPTSSKKNKLLKGEEELYKTIIKYSVAGGKDGHGLGFRYSQCSNPYKDIPASLKSWLNNLRKVNVNDFKP